LVLKVLSDDLETDGRFVRQFMDEARIAARIEHPNVASVFEVGKYGDHHAIVMEYLEGRSLAQMRRGARPAFSCEIELATIAEAMRGLHYAHELKRFDGAPLNMVHRDLSANNIFVTFNGEVKLLDFGLAKTADQSLQTEGNVLKGTLRYIAPESVQGRTVDRRADVYAAGVLLWEAVTQQSLWQGDSEAGFLEKVLRAKIPRATEANASIPPELDELTFAAMAGDPSARIPTAEVPRQQILAYLGRKAPIDLRLELSNVMSSMFGAQQDKRRRLTEQTLARLEQRSDQPPSSPVALFPPLESADARTQTVEDLKVTTIVPVTRPLEAKDVPAGARPRPRVRLALGGVAAAASGLLVAGWFVWQGPDQKRAAVAEQTAAEPAASEIVLQVIATPPDTTVTLDGQRLGSDLTAQVRQNRSARHVFRATRAGYEPQTVVVSAGQSDTVEITLQPVSPRPGSANPSKARPRAERRSTPPSTTTPVDQSSQSEIDRDNPWSR